MLRIGLTGGMGAGKSTVSKLLAERGAVVIDSDTIAREVVAPGTPGLAALVEAFGAQILNADGSLDRAGLAAVAFSSDAARKQLNEITHPLVGARTAAAIAAAPPDAIVVQDIPLLVENNLAPLFNLVVVVDAPVETRVARLAAHRGVPEADARARIAAQAGDAQRRAVADVWLNNEGHEGTVTADTERLWDERLVPFARNITDRIAAPLPVNVVAPNPEWAAQAQRLIARLWVLCGANALKIEHAGATAVPDSPAEDVLDIVITVADTAAVDSLAEPLAQAGFPQVEPGVHASADPGRPARVQLRIS